jgi:uncharacterized membrane protein
MLLVIDSAVIGFFSYIHETRDPNEFVFYILLLSPILILLAYMTILAAKRWPRSAGWK